MRCRLLLVLVVAAASAAFAASMPANNPSFENSGGTLVHPCGASCLYGYGVPQWSSIGATGILQPGTPDGWFNYVPNGQNVAFVDGGTVTNGRIYQVVGTAVPPSATARKSCQTSSVPWKTTRSSSCIRSADWARPR